jgi:hypothetical protein
LAAQWVKSGRLERVLAVSDAMRALHRDTLDCGRELLGELLYHDLIRASGHVHVWEGDDACPTEAIEQQIRDRHGIRSEPPDADEWRAAERTAACTPDDRPGTRHRSGAVRRAPFLTLMAVAPARKY